MGLADLVPPVASSHRDDGQLGQDDGPTEAVATSLERLSVVIPDGNKCLELGLLASKRLLLHRHILQNLLLEGCPGEKSQ